MGRREESTLVAQIFAWAATALWLVTFTGLFFHHSREPVLLHRFSHTDALGLLLVLVLAPLVFFGVRGLLSRYMAVFNDRIRALSAEEGLPILDFERDVPPAKELFIDEIHVTPRGARLEGELAARFLLSNGLVP
jgi:hypothetical protein